MAKQWAEECFKKVILPENLEKISQDIKNNHKTIATLNGSFDLLHAGHLQIIYEASQQADVLIVALNSDESIKLYKSPDRPIIPLKYRIEMLCALEFVTYVTWFLETDPRQILKTIQPDVHVNGAEYGFNCIEADTVTTYGGQIHIVPLIPGLSTSYILKKIGAISSKNL